MIKQSKRFIYFISVLIICARLAVIVNAEAPVVNEMPGGINVVINGKAFEFDPPPMLENHRTLVPLRALFEALGANVLWEQSTQTVTANIGYTLVTIEIGSNIMLKNGDSIKLDVPAKLVGDRTYIPLRAVAESFGADVDWDGATQTVYITNAPQRLIYNAAILQEPRYDIKYHDFTYKLTDGQIKATFPKLGIYGTYDTTAYYKNDGTLVEISAGGLIRISEYAFNDADYYLEAVGVPQTSNVYGVEVTSLAYPDAFRDGYFQSDFKMNNVNYRVFITNDRDTAKSMMAEIVNQLILGGAADLSIFNNPTIPDQSWHRWDSVTFSEALNDPDLGAYVPSDIPEGFVFMNALRIKNDNLDILSFEWVWHDKITGSADIDTMIGWEIIDVDNSELGVDYSKVYDLEKLTPDDVLACARWINWDNSRPGWWSIILFAQRGNIRIAIRSGGVSPDQIWDILNKLIKKL